MRRHRRAVEVGALLVDLRLGPHHDAGDAEPALQPAARGEGARRSARRSSASTPSSVTTSLPATLSSGEVAADDGLAVDEHGAAAALPRRRAAVLRRRDVELLAQRGEQVRVVGAHRHRRAVERELDAGRLGDIVTLYILSNGARIRSAFDVRDRESGRRRSRNPETRTPSSRSDESPRRRSSNTETADHAVHRASSRVLRRRAAQAPATAQEQSLAMNEAIVATDLTKSYKEVQRPRRAVARRAGRFGARPARAERRRQDDRRAHPHDAAAARHRHGRSSPGSTCSPIRPKRAARSASPASTPPSTRTSPASRTSTWSAACTTSEPSDVAGTGTRAARAVRSRRRRRPPGEDLLGRHAPPPRPRRRTRRPPAGAVPRRADHRARPAQPHRSVGRHRRARQGRHHAAADDAVPRGGRAARRQHPRHRPRHGDRRRHRRRAEGEGRRRAPRARRQRRRRGRHDRVDDHRRRLRSRRRSTAGASASRSPPGRRR